MTKQEKINAVHMGIDNMLFQTQEECAELIQAISKYNRARGIGQPTETTGLDAIDNLKVELADVEICIESLKYLMKLDNSDEKEDAIKKVSKRYE